MTVSNTTEVYTFLGSGNIAGASLLAKKGAGTLVLDNSGVNNFVGVTVSGTLQLGDGGTNGSLSALTIADDGALVVNHSDNLSLSSAISGAGSLTKAGAGALVLSGANSYSGATTVSGGTLQINGTSTGLGAITTAAGTTLAGSGTVSGPVTVGGQLNPGAVGGVGTFTANGGLTVASGGKLAFDLSATDPSPAANDGVAVTGNLTLNNNQVTVNFNGAPSPGRLTRCSPIRAACRAASIPSWPGRIMRPRSTPRRRAWFT